MLDKVWGILSNVSGVINKTDGNALGKRLMDQVRVTGIAVTGTLKSGESFAYTGLTFNISAVKYDSDTKPSNISQQTGSTPQNNQGGSNSNGNSQNGNT